MSIPEITTVTTADGMSLACRYLPGEGNPIIALHGFTGDSSTMVPLVDSCRDGRPAILVDVIGHGESSAPEHVEHYAMSSVVDQVLSLIGSYDPMTVHLVGYSMGGRIALSMAARAPWYFGSITLLSSTAGIADATDRSKRYDEDQLRATQLEADGLSPFITSWLASPLFAPYLATLDIAAYDATVAQRCAASATGLANSLRGTGTGSMSPLWHVLPSIRSPLLAIAGSLDDKYVAIAQEIASLVPFGQSKIVSGVGHVVHQENLDEVSATLQKFLAKCESDADHER